MTDLDLALAVQDLKLKVKQLEKWQNILVTKHNGLNEDLKKVQNRIVTKHNELVENTEKFVNHQNSVNTNTKIRLDRLAYKLTDFINHQTSVTEKLKM